MTNTPPRQPSTNAAAPSLMVFGPGLSAKGFIQKALGAGWAVAATYRRDEARTMLQDMGVAPVFFDGQTFDAASAPKAPTHILTSIAPERPSAEALTADNAKAAQNTAHHIDKTQKSGTQNPQAGGFTAGGLDPVLACAAAWLESRAASISWLGYLSATTVYGDHGGAVVSEHTPPAPSQTRGHRRLAAERAWQALGQSLSARCHVFRLAGIYGPGRNAVRTFLDGKAKAVVKPGHLFSRIHADDIAQALWLAASQSHIGSDIFNLADEKPMAGPDVTALIGRKLGLPLPAPVAFEDAELSAFARSFYSDNKIVSSEYTRQTLGLALKYPTLESALDDLIAYERG